MNAGVRLNNRKLLLKRRLPLGVEEGGSKMPVSV